MEKTDRAEQILAVILLQMLKDAPQRDKILQLNLAGFSNIEIANILQTTTGVVSQSIYEMRQGKKRLLKKKTSQTR